MTYVYVTARILEIPCFYNETCVFVCKSELLNRSMLSDPHQRHTRNNNKHDEWVQIEDKCLLQPKRKQRFNKCSSM